MRLSETSLSERLEEEQSQSRRMEKEESIAFGNGLGEIVFDKGTDGIVAVIKKECEDLISGMPKKIIDDLRLKTQIDEIALRIRIEPQSQISLINS
jgi:hypothetical protein